MGMLAGLFAPSLCLSGTGWAVVSIVAGSLAFPAIISCCRSAATRKRLRYSSRSSTVSSLSSSRRCAARAFAASMVSPGGPPLTLTLTPPIGSESRQLARDFNQKIAAVMFPALARSNSLLLTIASPSANPFLIA